MQCTLSVYLYCLVIVETLFDVSLSLVQVGRSEGSGGVGWGKGVSQRGTAPDQRGATLRLGQLHVCGTQPGRGTAQGSLARRVRWVQPSWSVWVHVSLV